MADTREIIEELKKRIAGEVRFDRTSRILYSTDASIYEIEPLGVVIPRTTDDLQAAVEVASKYQVPIVPRGGGTSIVGNAIGSGIVLDCSKYLNKIVEVNAEEGWARVQPGVVLDQLNGHVAQYGLLFGPDVATSNRANIGGMIGNNSSGAHSVVYGKTIDHVLELDVLLSNGERAKLCSQSEEAWKNRLGKNGFLNAASSRLDELIRENHDEIKKRFPKIMRRVAGYNLDEFVNGSENNLSKLIVGSEGTLAVVTEAKVNLEPLKQHKTLGIVQFEDLLSALDSVSRILEFDPCAVELLDNNILDLTRGTQEYARRLTFVEGFPKALLLVEFQSDSNPEVLDKLNKLEAFIRREKIGYAFYKATDAEQQANVWYIRKAGLGLLLGTKADRKPIGFIEDSAVAPEKLPQYIARFDEIVRAYGTDAAYYAHASVGCLHIRPKLNLKNPSDVRAMAKMADEVSSLVFEFGGTISGEHGDGLAHSCWNEKMFGPKLYEAFCELKKAFDPKNIMNPGKIVHAQSLTENFRRAPQRESLTFTPFWDYASEGGLENAIELCNGNGACRKVGAGTMCPSYMVTLEEEHSTRGRANTLRAILTGKLTPDHFTGKRLHETFDLCIECKGCKGECPTNVDMAKLKYEFLYQYHKKHGLPLRDRFFGNIAALNRFGSLTAPLSNMLLNQRQVRTLILGLLGVHTSRTMPPFRRETFEKWFSAHKERARERGEKSERVQKSRGSGKVAFFHDTFTNYNYPELGKAAVTLLEGLGYEVTLAEKKCCGRPMISKGMLEEARVNALFNVDKLHSLVQDGHAIVGLEPSCMLTFREEYPDMLASKQVQIVADNTFLLEEFLLSENSDIKARFRPTEKKFLLHGHCHLKALIGIEPTVTLLQLIPNAVVEVVDSGCCGMAGSFGYEKEHYEISMAMGRRKLFEAVVAADPECEIVAPGVSCRQQIEHGTGRQAKHPVEVLAEHLLV